MNYTLYIVIIIIIFVVVKKVILCCYDPKSPNITKRKRHESDEVNEVRERKREIERL